MSLPPHLVRNENRSEWFSPVKVTGNILRHETSAPLRRNEPEWILQQQPDYILRVGPFMQSSFWSLFKSPLVTWLSFVLHYLSAVIYLQRQRQRQRTDPPLCKVEENGCLEKWSRTEAAPPVTFRKNLLRINCLYRNNSSPSCYSLLGLFCVGSLFKSRFKYDARFLLTTCFSTAFGWTPYQALT